MRGLEAGADDFLTKPVNDIALFARVRSLVRLKRMMEELRLREEICGRFNSLIEKQVRRKRIPSPARILLWEENAFAAARIAEMLGPLVGETVRPLDGCEDLARLAIDSIELVILSMSGQTVDALRARLAAPRQRAEPPRADPADRRSTTNCRGSPRASISAPTTISCGRSTATS